MNESTVYPFAAIVGQEEMKLALILNIINPTLSGVLIRGEKGTGKSTAVRALAKILSGIEMIPGCPFRLAPSESGRQTCRDCSRDACRQAVFSGDAVETESRKVRLVELPVGATEDRVVGTMDLERALKEGEKHFEPGILAAAHRGILYVDEVNLLDDHVVDVLLDSAAMGVCTVEREGVSFTHPARFTLVGTMNPEEGELRPQLLDRFGLCVQIQGIRDAGGRVEVMERRADFDEDPTAFEKLWQEESSNLAQRIEKASALLPEVKADRDIMFQIANLCLQAGVDGHRSDIITLKAAKSLACYEGRDRVEAGDVERAAALALPHRMRRQPFEDITAPAVNQGRA
ncbi:MAG: ATP-binding protein [Desulfarculaceae bacterium]